MDKKIDKFIVDIIKGGLENDISKIEAASLSLSRILKKDSPEISNKINEIISQYTSTSSPIRGNFKQPPPVNEDSQLEMVAILSPNEEANVRPIFNDSFNQRIDSFLDERQRLSILLEQGIKPSNSLLLIGLPGTGKTMCAKFIASALHKNLIVLDLSSSISSLLGKTGSNLKRVLNYAKNTASVLLLDEFDAIAKRRDDVTDLGEIKRVVNVLLMELENWPISSVVIATSNHPELLDRAIWRRFDHVWDLSVPDDAERKDLLNKEVGAFSSSISNWNILIEILTEFLKGKSAADICKYSNNLKRRIVLKKEDFILASLSELVPYISDKKARGKLCNVAKEKLGDLITLRDLSTITGLSIPGVQHHVTKSISDEQ